MIQTLVSDPPWRFNDSLPGPGRGAVKHYDLLSIEDIKNFELPPLADDARLFLWRVASMQEESLEVARAWGFVPKAELVWVKVTKAGPPHLRIGMGRQTRNAHETCLVATRGRPERLSASVPSVFYAQRQLHSQKPDEFYDIVEQLSPGPYYEMFARKVRPGWEQMGDELGKLD